MTAFDFSGDGRHKRAPMPCVIGVQPIALTNSQARQAIDRFLQHGSSTHSGQGGMVWAIVGYCNEQRIPFRLTSLPGQAYLIEKVNLDALG